MATIEEIIAREKSVRASLVDAAVTEIDIAPFFHAQVGLLPCMVGPDGRIWATSSTDRVMKVVFDPKWITEPRRFRP